MSAAERAGELIVGGFTGTSAPAEVLSRIVAGHLGGAILFARNVVDPGQVLALNQQLAAASPAGRPLLIAVDQEGGRVARIRAPATVWPAMRQVGDRDDLQLTRAVGQALGSELAALGFNLDFAPVMDVFTNPDNKVIGDRAFGSTPDRVIAHGLAFAEGLGAAGVIACAKHFPGHGDTLLDSHLALPVVQHDRQRLEAVELRPFAAAARAGVPTLMTAHVICTAYDDRPATLSRRLLQEVLRDELGYRGVVVSDDLEMAAIAAHTAVPRAAVEAVRAGCDLLLICHKAELQEQARLAIAAEADQDRAFAARLEESLARIEALRARPELSTSRAAADAAGLATLLGTDEHLALAARAGAGEGAPAGTDPTEAATRG
jgi:beta-N-acetylhexosaminidase